MSDYLKDMFIEVREKTKQTSPLNELEQIIDSVTKVIYDKAIVSEKKSQDLTFKLSMIPEIEVSELGWSDVRTPDGGD